MKKYVAWLLLVLGLAAVVQSYFGCRPYWIGSGLITYSMPCLAISTVIGLALIVAGIILLKKAK